MNSEKDSCKLIEKIASERFKEKKRSVNDREFYVFCQATSRLETVASSHPNLHTLVVVGQPEVTSVEVIAELIHLKELWIVECSLKDVRALKKCKRLQKLYLYANEIREIPDLSNCKNLKILSLARNRISDITNIQELPKLQDINLADNDVRKIPNIFSKAFELLHINLSGNPLSRLQDLENLSTLTKLQSIEFGDPFYGECPLVSMCNYRSYLIRRLPNLREIDYYPVELEERFDRANNELTICNKMSNKYLCNGLLNKNSISKFFGFDELLQIKYLTITNCSIVEVNFENISLPHLESLDMSKNRISSIRGFNNLKKLHTLCLSNNQLRKLKEKNSLKNSNEVFPNLIVLYADHNKLRSIEEADFPKMPSLKYLFLQYNRINDINELKNFPSLNTAILDHNRIENVPEDLFKSNGDLKTLMLESNKLTQLGFVKNLSKIEKLFVANNKIENHRELDNLKMLQNLKELTLFGNPFCQWCNHYVEISEKIKSIKILDGHNMNLDDSVEVS